MTSLARVENNAATESREFNPWLILAIGIFAATFAGPFIKLAQINGLPSVVIAFGRMGLATLLMTPYILNNYRAELRQLTARDILLAMGAGTFMLAHFILLNNALERASMLIVLVIVNTGPLWVALLERTFLKQSINRYVWIGMGLTIIGSSYIALSASNSNDRTADTLVLGAILALSAAIAGASYITIGRSVRQKVSLFPYVWILFGFGGIVGLVYALVSGTPIVGHPSGGYFWLIMLTLIPQLIGHSGFNYALGYISATLTSLSSQLLTVTGSIAAYFMFAEVPTVNDLIGSAIIGAGVLMAIIYRARSVAKS